MISKKLEKKVCIIGPVSPYRGGVAQYTDSLAKSFEKYADVTVLSFSRQYPKFLYPGETDKLDGSIYNDNVLYVLDSNNPISWYMTYKRIIDIAPDVVFINWWTIYWQPAFVYMARRLRRNGIKVIYLCHNVYDHDASRLKKRITGTLIKSADGFLVHAEEQKTLLSGILGDTNKPILVRQLPVYDIMPEPRVRVKDPCDQSYKLKVLFIGLIRPYKGLDVLIEAYSRLKKGLRDTIELRVVGEYWGDKIELEGRLNKLGIKHDLRFVTDQEAVDYIGESDLLALPYKSASGSAVVPLAYYCGKPVIVTSVGGLVDVVEDRKTGWVIEPNNAVSLAEKLSMISRSECSKMEKDIQKWVNKNSWDEMAKELMKIFVSNK